MEHHTHSHDRPLNLNGESFKTEKSLKFAFFLTLVILIIEFSGALISKSMALYSESGHVLVDASSLLLAWFAQTQVRKSPSEKNTYGYHRIGILAAL
ncbi:MAG: cation transporter, partial [Deltaproteobacteria bacterium]|nr:cation transporter [Deltaproteobacteria bacterium]